MNDKSTQPASPGARGAAGPYPITAHIAAIPSGRARTFFATDVVGTLAGLDSTPGSTEQTPLMAVSWPMGTDIGRAIQSLVRTLAGLALARWPDWYGECAPFSPPDAGGEVAADQDAPAIDRLGAAIPALNRAWARQAILRCRSGEAPTLFAFTPAVQVRQLALALAQPNLVLLLALERTDCEPEELQCFARAAVWFAGETGMRVGAVVPEAYREAAELDSISYDAIYLENSTPLQYIPATTLDRDSTTAVRIQQAREGVEGIPPTTPENLARRRAPGPRCDEPLRLVIPPILGRPHPASPGEQLLALWLGRDPELAPLFGFNQRVTTSSGESFIVDLLWHSGKLTVEVDGYWWHSSPHTFAADRHRDYRLLSDGYRTLRLPHDEVMDDPALQCEKIRDVVRAIQKER